MKIKNILLNPVLLATILLSVLTIGEALAQDSKTALVVSYQNDAGYWFAGGPTQWIQAGEKTEEEALDYVYNDKKDSLRYLGRHGKFRVYSLDRDLYSYDTDVRKKLSRNGVDLPY